MGFAAEILTLWWAQFTTLKSVTKVFVTFYNLHDKSHEFLVAVYACVMYTKEFLGENLTVLNYQSMVFLISHLQNKCCLRWLPILIPYKLVISSLHWTKSDISCCRTQVGYAHDIPCPQHISSQHDISHFLPHVMEG